LSVSRQEDAEVVREGYEALAQDGVEAFLLQFVHPEFETTTPPSMTVEPDTYRGHDGLRRYFAAFEGIMEDVRFVADDVIDAGGCVIVPGRLEARGAGTGIPVEQRFWQVWWLRDGKGVRLETYPDRDGAFAAAGIEG
jgi:ketosteroid isomerase-like protein